MTADAAALVDHLRPERARDIAFQSTLLSSIRAAMTRRPGLVQGRHQAELCSMSAFSAQRVTGTAFTTACRVNPHAMRTKRLLRRRYRDHVALARHKPRRGIVGAAAEAPIVLATRLAKCGVRLDAEREDKGNCIGPPFAQRITSAVATRVSARSNVRFGATSTTSRF
jgi:hypothetical protein